MNKKLRNAKLGVVLATLTLFVCVFGYFSLNNSVAWFAINREVQSNGIEIALTDVNDKVDGEIEYYAISAISLDENRNNIYYFSSQKITDPSEMKLGTLSYVVAERQLLVKIPLKQGVTSVRVSASTSKDYVLNSLAENEKFPDEDKIYPLSSVIEMRAISDLTTSTVAGMEGGVYVIETTSERLTPPVTFLSGTQPTDGKYPFSQGTSLPLYTTPARESDEAIFILLDYYEDSAELINTRALGTATVGLEENAIQFACDFIFTIE